MSAPRRRTRQRAAFRAGSFSKDTEGESVTALSRRTIHGLLGHGSVWPTRLPPKPYYGLAGASCTTKRTMMHPKPVISAPRNRSTLRSTVILHSHYAMVCRTRLLSRTSIRVSSPCPEPSAILPIWWIRRRAGQREYGSGVSGSNGRSNGIWW